MVHLIKARIIFDNGHERIYREGSPGFETFRDAMDQEAEFFDNLGLYQRYTAIHRQ